jgi:GT2 family glycosyltransferase
VLFTPHWREICIQHLDAWADVGIVGPMSDYVSGSQKTEEREAPDEDLDAFARRFTATHQGDHDYTNRLILFFMMCRRELLDRIGGIDPIFGRWGFEDDDFCLRALRAGYQLRVARDCFIRHLGSRTARTAGLDYGALLTENWLIFKRKWGLPAELAYGSSWDVASIADVPFTDDLHVPFTAGVPRGVAATR